MYKDFRGTLLFPIKNNKYINNNINISKDCTYSINYKNVFRGLHINSFGKLITCINGKFIDIMVNIKTFEVKYYKIETGDQIYCPPNFAHGFITLEDNSILSYHYEGNFTTDKSYLLNYKDPILNIQLENYGIDENKIIISDKDKNAPFLKFDYFLLGHNGFIGSHILNELNKLNKSVHCLKFRMEDLKNIKKYFSIYKPKYFINAAGLTGYPNTDWCNNNKKETLMTNVINQINILNICNEYNIHCTLIGSGAIFKNSLIPKYSTDCGDLINNNNYYAESRILLEKLIIPFKNCLLLRINYPLSSIQNNKNLLNKLINYKEIEKINLSVTILDSLIPKLPLMIENNETGVFNFINKNQLNIAEFITNYYNFKNLKNDKIFIDTKRESPLLICDKLNKYNIDTTEEAIIKYLFHYN